MLDDYLKAIRASETLHRKMTSDMAAVTKVTLGNSSLFEALRVSDAARKAMLANHMAGFRAYAKITGQIPPYAVYQGQSAQIMFDAIARSNGTRASVTSQLFKTNVKNGIMGDIHFDKNGDTFPIKAITFDKLSGDTGKYAFVVITKVKG